MPQRVLLPILLALACAPYLVDLGGSSIWDANEAFYTETPREMIERGDYISPTFNYEPRLNKPVLSYWIVAAFYRLFGISVGVERVPIALAALVLVLTALCLGRLAVECDLSAGERGCAERRWHAGMWAAVGLAISPRLLMFARRIFIDVFVTMFMGLTLLFFALAERYPGRRRLFLALMYTAVGLGVLTKGPVAAVLPALVFAAYLLVHREVGRLREMMLPAGIAIVAAIVAPWYVALYVRHGWEPIVSFFLGENVARYTEGVGVDAERGPLFYLPVIVSDSFPWSFWLFAAFAAWMAARRHPAARLDRSHRTQALLWLWIAIIVLFFSMSAAKQDLYIFPIVPAVAALGGALLATRLSPADPGAAGARWTAAAIGVALVLLGAGVLYLFQTARAVYVLEGILTVGLALLAGGMSAAYLAVRRRLNGSVAAIAITMIVFSWTFVLRVLPSFEVYKPVPHFARAIEARAGTDDVVATYDVAVPSLVYYTRRHVASLFDDDALVRLLTANQQAFVVLTEHNYERVRAGSDVEVCAIEKRPTFDVKLRDVLARRTPPELVLATNRCAGESGRN